MGSGAGNKGDGGLIMEPLGLGYSKKHESKRGVSMGKGFIFTFDRDLKVKLRKLVIKVFNRLVSSVILHIE